MQLLAYKQAAAVKSESELRQQQQQQQQLANRQLKVHAPHIHTHETDKNLPRIAENRLEKMLRKKDFFFLLQSL